MKQVKVLYIIRPAEGGMKEHVFSLIKNSDQQRFAIIVACPKAGSMANQMEKLGIPVFPLDLKGELDFKADFQSVAQLIKLIIKEKVTLVHCHGSKAGLVGRMAAILAGVPVIVFTAHNFIFDDQMPIWKQKVLARSEKLLAYNTGKIIAVSRAIEDNLVKTERINPNKIITVYNGIENEKYQKGRDLPLMRERLGLGSGPVVGIVARLAPQKGLNYFLEAAAEVVKVFPNCQFVIAGDGPLKKPLADLTSKLNLANQVQFLGHRQDVEEILPLMDIFVLSSVTEGFPLTILEAMAAGRPVVATRVGGIPEVITHGRTGLLVELRDSLGLAAAMIELLRDPGKAAAMGHRGRRLVNQKFCIGSMVEKTMEVYTQLLADKGLFSKQGQSVLE